MSVKAFANIWFLIQKDLNIELRQRYILTSILLYVVSTVFIISKILQTVSPMLWNAIFWVVFIFTAVSAMMKSFTQEMSDRSLYYYYLVGPIEIILAKFIYNFFSLMAMGLLLSVSFIIFINNPIDNYFYFFLGVTLGALGIGVIFTLVSSIASSGGNSATLMSVLAIPLVLPVILFNLQITGTALNILQDTAIVNNISLLLAIIGILIGVSLFLFPQIWRT
ncbi:heme exporter protein CcmB [Portibacter marinus]|uniref:heme exporter protein CcmB n=1 Tax=Portibacter marinus TaxID=2898660 RepID=UPI001F288230|nr:heme exporter protein CcmB [Portibacter marinus]